MHSPNKKILVSYFAVFRERAGRSEETIQTACETTATSIVNSPSVIR